MRLSALIETRQPGKPCSMAVALKAIAEVDAELHRDVLDWLDGEYPDWSDSDIHAALQSQGHRVGQQQIGHHRRAHRHDHGKRCGCVL